MGRKPGGRNRNIPALVARLRRALATPRSDTELMAELGVGAADLRYLKRKLLEEERLHLEKTPLEVYAEYRLGIMSALTDLDDIIKTLKKMSPPSAATAVRTKAELLAKLIETGQKLGVVAKRPQQVQVLAHIAALSDDALHVEIERVTASLTRLAALPPMPASDQFVIEDEGKDT